MRLGTRGLPANLVGPGLVALGPAAAASAHEERDAQAPDGSGSVPTYRTDCPRLLACKTDAVDFTKRVAAFPAELLAANQALFAQCHTSVYRNLQEAVGAVKTPVVTTKILHGGYP